MHSGSQDPCYAHPKGFFGSDEVKMACIATRYSFENLNEQHDTCK